MRAEPNPFRCFPRPLQGERESREAARERGDAYPQYPQPRALAGIGCHWMATLVNPQQTATASHMGGEGAMWLGQQPFTRQDHVFANIGVAVPQDNVWWTQEISVQGNVVTVSIDGKKVVEYDEPPGAVAGKDFERKLGSGTFALQAHDPKSVVHYRNIRVKRLPE